MKFCVIDKVNLLPETQEQIKQIIREDLEFHNQISCNEQKLVELTKDANVVLVNTSTNIKASYFKKCPKVKHIEICGTSKNNIDLQAAAKNNVSVNNVVDYGDEPTAEFIFMNLVFLARGLGNSIARLALAYKMETSYYSRTQKPEWEKQGLKFWNKKHLLQNSDIIVISTPSNFKAIEKNEFAFLKPGNIIVQASGGECIHRQSLLERTSQAKGFALFDYAAGEEVYSLYKNQPNVIFPKIVAGYTHETKQRLGNKVIFNIKTYIGDNFAAK